MRLTKQILDALKHSEEYTSALFDVDPEGAAELLKINIGNRPVHKGAVERYAKTMADGEWIVSGEGMTVLNGILISGQKRCLAIIKSGATIRTPIVFGVDPRSRAVIDGGQPRKTFAFSGLPPYVQEVLSTACRIALGHKERPGVSAVEAAVSSPLCQKVIGLYELAPSTRRGVTSASVRLAYAVGQLEWPAAASHIADQYRAMSISAFDRFSAITGILCRQLTSGEMTGGGLVVANKRFCRSMIAIDPENAQAKTIRIRDDYPVVLEKYRSIVLRHIGVKE